MVAVRSPALPALAYLRSIQDVQNSQPEPSLPQNLNTLTQLLPQ